MIAPLLHKADRIDATEPRSTPTRADMSKTALRVGEGWDTHALVAGRALILGGVATVSTVVTLGAGRRLFTADERLVPLLREAEGP